MTKNTTIKENLFSSMSNQDFEHLAFKIGTHAEIQYEGKLLICGKEELRGKKSLGVICDKGKYIFSDSFFSKEFHQLPKYKHGYEHTYSGAIAIISENILNFIKLNEPNQLDSY